MEIQIDNKLVIKRKIALCNTQYIIHTVNVHVPSVRVYKQFK